MDATKDVKGYIGITYSPSNLLSRLTFTLVDKKRDAEGAIKTTKEIIKLKDEQNLLLHRHFGSKATLTITEDKDEKDCHTILAVLEIGAYVKASTPTINRARKHIRFALDAANKKGNANNIRKFLSQFSDDKEFCVSRFIRKHIVDELEPKHSALIWEMCVASCNETFGTRLNGKMSEEHASVQSFLCEHVDRVFTSKGFYTGEEFLTNLILASEDPLPEAIAAFNELEVGPSPYYLRPDSFQKLLPESVQRPFRRMLFTLVYQGKGTTKIEDPGEIVRAVEKGIALKGPSEKTVYHPLVRNLEKKLCSIVKNRTEPTDETIENLTDVLDEDFAAVVCDSMYVKKVMAELLLASPKGKKQVVIVTPDRHVLNLIKRMTSSFPVLTWRHAHNIRASTATELIIMPFAERWGLQAMVHTLSHVSDKRVILVGDPLMLPTAPSIGKPFQDMIFFRMPRHYYFASEEIIPKRISSSLWAQLRCKTPNKAAILKELKFKTPKELDSKDLHKSAIIVSDYRSDSKELETAICRARDILDIKKWKRTFSVKDVIVSSVAPGPLVIHSFVLTANPKVTVPFTTMDIYFRSSQIYSIRCCNGTIIPFNPEMVQKRLVIPIRMFQLVPLKRYSRVTLIVSNGPYTSISRRNLSEIMRKTKKQFTLVADSEESLQKVLDKRFSSFRTLTFT